MLIVMGIHGASFLGAEEETLLIPMAMLSLFVLSAAIMGYLFLSEPLLLYFENRKKEAASFFLRTVGYFACFVAFFMIVMLYVSFGM